MIRFIKNHSKKALLELVEIYEFRNILRSLVTKDLFGRYRNSILGFSWNFITPLILMIMYYIVFTEVNVDTHIAYKWVFISTAIFLFHFMSRCITGGTNAFTNNAGMIKKMYFPREILALSSATSSMVVCITGYAIVLLGLIVTGFPINWATALYLPLILSLAFIFGIGAILFLSSITVYIRDIQYLLGTMGIALFVMTPMRYMASDATGILSTVVWYNPLTYYMECVHNVLYWGIAPMGGHLIMCTIISFVTLLVGYITFKKLKRGFVKKL